MKSEKSEPLLPIHINLYSILHEAIERIRPRKKLTVSQWADEFRILPDGSPEPGHFRSSRTPYLIPILDCYTDPHYEIVVGVCGAQMGKTENVFNIIGHTFSEKPVPMLFVLPTQDLARSLSQGRLDDMLESTPILWQRLNKSSEKNKVTEKFIAGQRLGFAWATSATKLSSHPAGIVMFDEVDKMNLDAGGEGDPIILGKARTKNYPDSKIGCWSTPTKEGESKIWKLWESGTMGRFAIPCKHCNVFFIPLLSLLIWPEKSTPIEAEKAVRLTCPKCGGQMNTLDKDQATKKGKYIFHTMDENGNYIACGFEPPKSKTASFQISGICSPWVSLGEIAYTLLTAYRSGEQETIQSVVNAWGGELYRQDGDKPEDTDIDTLVSGYEPLTVPEGVQMIVMGCDIQKNGIYYIIRGFGFNSGSWKIHNGYIQGETKYSAVWTQLAIILQQDIDGHRINRAFVDSGYNTDQVYAFCRQFKSVAYPVKGHDTQDKSIKASKVDVTHNGKIFKGGLVLWHVNTDYYKTWIYARIRWDVTQSGAWNLDSGTDQDYKNQINSEQLIVTSSGRRIWKQTRKDNHYLDCEVYCAACASSLQVHALKDITLAGKDESSVTIKNVTKSIIQKPSRGFTRR